MRGPFSEFLYFLPFHFTIRWRPYFEGFVRELFDSRHKSHTPEDALVSRFQCNMLRLRNILHYAYISYKGGKQTIFAEGKICYTSGARVAKLHEVKSTFFRAAYDTFPSISVEKDAFVCVQWRVRNLLFLINWRTITFKIMVLYNYKKERRPRMWLLQGWDRRRGVGVPMTPRPKSPKVEF